MHPGEERRNPPWWNHQRHVLVALRRAVEELLPRATRDGGRVVDLGCGDRPYEPLIRARGWEYVACDLGGEGVIPIVPGTPLSLPAGGARGVVSFQVLEHVWDLDWYLEECRRLLAADGWLLLSTHGTWLYHPHPQDYRRWTRDGLERELQTRGFETEKVLGIVGPLAWTTQFRLLGLRQAVLHLPLLGRGAAAALALLMNLRMALEDRITPASIREANACVYVMLCRRAEEVATG